MKINKSFKTFKKTNNKEAQQENNQSLQEKSTSKTNPDRLKPETDYVKNIANNYANIFLIKITLITAIMMFLLEYISRKISICS